MKLSYLLSPFFFFCLSELQLKLKKRTHANDSIKIYLRVMVRELKRFAFFFQPDVFFHDIFVAILTDIKWAL